MPNDPPPTVAAAFAAMPRDALPGLMHLRALIFEVAASDPRVGTLSEELRWGQPAYLTAETKAGTTLRLGVPKNAKFAIFAHCQTSVISDFAALWPGQDRLDGNRGVLFDDAGEIAPARHRLLIAAALTYHL